MGLGPAGLLPSLPTAWLAGRDLDLLEPLRFVPPGGRPSPPSGSPSGIPSGIHGAPDRRELAAALAVANRGYGHEGADRLAQKLADPATRVVVAGQQPGLLGGPLYTFSKAVAATLWAEALEAAGEPAVAVFWVATEDHDWAEVSSAVVLAPDGPRRFDLGPDPDPLLPAGMRALGPEVERVLAEAAEAVPGERYAEWLATVARWYRPDARFGEAFCRLLAHLLGPRCPLLLDSMLPELKEAERPWLRRIVERRAEVEAAFARQDAAVEARGHDLQVSPQRGASPLFLLQGGERRRIEWRDGDSFALRGRPEGLRGVDDLLRTIEDNPGVVSPGVLARPAVQDAVLGTTLMLLGPGELSYMAQAAAIYPVLGVAAPAVALRPQGLVLEGHQVEKLEELGISLADLLGERSRLDHILAERQNGGFVEPVRRRVEEALEGLREPALAADPNLERPFDKTRDQILRALDLFGDKAVAAAARRNELATRRIEQLREACLPLGRMQERVVTPAHFQGKYGARFVESYWDQMDVDRPGELQVIVP